MSQKGGDFDPPNNSNTTQSSSSQLHSNSQYSMMQPNLHQMTTNPYGQVGLNPWEWWNNPYNTYGASMSMSNNPGMMYDMNYRDTEAVSHKR